MHAAQLDPLAVGAAIDAVERSAPRWMALEHLPVETLPRYLCLKEQGARHQRGLNLASPACRFTREECCSNAGGGEESGPHARQGVHDMHRRGPKPRHAGAEARGGSPK